MSITYEINASGNFEQRMARAKEVLDKVDGKVKDWKESTAALGREQQKWLNAIQTPQEKYIQNLNKIKILQEKGKLTAEEAGRAAVKAYDSMNAKLDSSNSKLTSYLTKWASIGSAITLATQALNAHEQSKQASRDTQEGSADAVAQLSQMVRGRERDIALAHLRNAKRYIGGGESGATQSAELVMSLLGMGELGSSETFARMRGSGLVGGDMGATLTSVGQVQEAYSAQTGKRISPEQVIASQLQASQLANKKFEPIMQYASKAINAGMSRGMAYDEALSAYTAITGTQTVEQAADAFSAFMEQASNEGLISRPGMTFAEIQKAAKDSGYAFTGAAFRAQPNAANYRAMKSLVSAGMKDPMGIIDQSIESTYSGLDEFSLYNRERLMARQKEADRDIAKAALGADQRRKEGIIAEYEARSPAWFSSLDAMIMRNLPIGADAVQAMTDDVYKYRPGNTDATVNAIRQQTRELLKTQPKAPPTATVNP